MFSYIKNMSLPTRDKRAKSLTVRITDRTYKNLVRLTEKHNLSQSDVIEHLIKAEAEETKRLKGKSGRYKRGSTKT